MKIGKLILLVVLAGTPYMYGISLDKTLQDVLATHPDILEKQKSYNAAIYGVEAARSGFFPTIVFESEIGHQRKKEASTSYKHEKSSYWDARITARETLYDGDKTGLDVDIQEAYAYSSLYGYLRVANNVVFDTIKAYVNVLKLHELKGLAKENVLAHQSILKSAKVRLEKGNQGRSELERVLGRLSTARTKMMLRQSEYEKSLYALHKLLGRFVAYKNMVKPRFDDALLPHSLKEALHVQVANHPAYKEGDYMMSQKDYEYKREKSERVGRLYLEASVGASDEENKEDENDAYIALKYNHMLFDGGKRSNRIQKAMSVMHEEQQKQYSVRRVLRHDLELTWSSYKLLYSQIGEMKKSLYFTKKALATYQDEFRIGRRMLITILDAQNEYQNALDQLTAMKYNLLIEKFHVLYSEGTLLEHLGVVTSQTRELLVKDAKEHETMTKDMLPLSDDFDKDGIKEPYDISVNSLLGQRVNSLGVNKNIMGETKLDESAMKSREAQVRIVKSKQDMIDNPLAPNVLTQFDFVSFDKKSIELSSKSQDTMRYLIEQLKKYASEGTLHVQVGTNEFKDEYKNYRLALDRAYNFKRILQNHHMDSSSISVFADTRKKDLKSYLGVTIVNDSEGYKRGYETKISKKNIFKKESSVLGKYGEEFLVQVAKDIKQHVIKHVDMIAYSNDFENPVKNRNLSIKRAKVLFWKLTKQGIEKEKIFSFGWGKYRNTNYLISSDNESLSKVEYILRNE